MKPQEPIPHNYSIRGLNLIFAVSSIGLLVVTGLMVGYDYIRGWKWFQLEFMRMQQERITQESQSAQGAENKQQLGDLDAQDRKNSLERAAHRDQYLSAQKTLDAIEGDHYRADQDYGSPRPHLMPSGTSRGRSFSTRTPPGSSRSSSTRQTPVAGSFQEVTASATLQSERSVAEETKMPRIRKS